MMHNTNCLLVILWYAILLNGCSKGNEAFTPIPEPKSKPEISFTYTGANTYAPDAVSFANTTTNAFSYTWNFGDNYTSSEGNPVHVYTQGGTYMVKLIATGESGTDSSTQSVTVLDAPTTLKITQILLTDFSFQKSIGVNWDSINGPDVYFTITNSDSIVHYNGISLTDTNVIQSDLPLLWTLPVPFTITDFSKYKAVKIYDNDSPNPDEYIGKAGFTPSSFTTVQDHYPSTIDITSGDVFITLLLTWQ